MVSSKAYSESLSHRYLPDSNKLEGTYNDAKKAKFFMWESENPAPIESEAQKPNFNKFLENYKSEEDKRSGKVPYVFDYVPSSFLKSPTLKKSFNDFSTKRGVEKQRQTKGTVLLTYYRSGSSFLGQLFNQNPEVFYHFEPLFPFTRDCSSDSPAFKNEKIENLERILACDMPNMRNLTQKIPDFNQNLYNSRICLLTGACFRFNSLSLCDPQLCPQFPVGELKCSSCGPLNLEVTDDLCRQKKMTVVKTIRICNGSWLESISNSMSLKIVHLIRDPRAIAKSRLSVPDDPITEGEIVKNITDLCKQQMLTHDKNFGKDEYSTVLYEDLNRMPFEKAQEIYDFVGLDFHPKVKGWIQRKKTVIHNQIIQAKNPFGTYRNAAAVLETWPSKLSYEIVAGIQEGCEELMEEFGYKFVRSKEEYEDKSVSYLPDIES
ncbi:unnamed protein product [Oikopleura dioica]|uniref:Uncharacterized protein n=1 Tax=Oikopleura dioica TaxID=34765 RepID=E4WR10_OIKDI|nr:unnamed protein product [Oikopleura dioica]